MSELVFLKLGGSLITDKTTPETAREDVIRNIAKQVKRALADKPGISLVLGHGGGSFPHYPAKKYRVNEGIINEDSWKGFAETRVMASKLNQIVTSIFLSEGVNVVSLQPSSSVISEGGKLKHMSTRQMNLLLRHGQIPVTYGDAVLDEKKGVTILSTEDLFYYLTNELSPKRIILVGKMAGVYDHDPVKDKGAKLIPAITNHNIQEVKKSLGSAQGFDVTGGMLTKVMEMYHLVELYPSLQIQLINADDDSVYKSLTGKQVEGTTVAYDGKSPIPKILFVDVGELFEEGYRPWYTFLKNLVKEGIIPEEVWDEKLKPYVTRFLSREFGREEAVRIIIPAYASALKGANMAKVREIAVKTYEEAKQHTDKQMMKIVNFAMKERGYKVAIVAAYIGEILEPLARDMGVELYTNKLAETNGTVTGELAEQVLTYDSKKEIIKAVRDREGLPRQKTMYLGDNIEDWQSIQECGVGLVFQPNLETGIGMTDRERETAATLLSLIREGKLNNVIVLSKKAANIPLKELMKE